MVVIFFFGIIKCFNASKNVTISRLAIRYTADDEIKYLSGLFIKKSRKSIILYTDTTVQLYSTFVKIQGRPCKIKQIFLTLSQDFSMLYKIDI
jgi:hypothetical protein